MERPIKDFSEVELKAIGYEATKEINRLSHILQGIDNELASRAQKAQPKPKMENETKTEEVIDAPLTPEETTEEATA